MYINYDNDTNNNNDDDDNTTTTTTTNDNTNINTSTNTNDNNDMITMYYDMIQYNILYYNIIYYSILYNNIVQAAAKGGKPTSCFRNGNKVAGKRKGDHSYYYIFVYIHYICM